MNKSRLEQAFDTAVQHHQAGRLVEAETHYRGVLANQPTHADALHLLGVLMAQTERYADAADLIGRACKLSPNLPTYHMHLGNALSGKKEYQAAIDAYRLAIRLDPACFGAHDGLGAALRETGRLDEAVASHHRSLQISPNRAGTHYNLGLTLAVKHSLNEAMACYRRAIAIDPHFADAHVNLSMLLLSLGDFDHGWQEYEWRWRQKNFPRLWPNFTQPFWKGEDLKGKAILIHTEQGYGDAAQFVRYSSMLAGRGARVILLCQAAVARLMTNAQGVDHVVPAIVSPDELPPFDVHCPIMSLPLLFGTRIESIPNKVPYLKADPVLVQEWSAKAGDSAGRLKVGLVWAGSPTNKNDLLRSIQLQQLSPLARSGATFYSLQKGPASSQAADPSAGMEWIDLSEGLHDFADTAALISHLDLIITVDTAVAHIAGAMGKSAWVLLASEHDWRWLLNREDSPWYPTLRLFRQTTPGDWPEVIGRVAAELVKCVQQRHTDRPSA